MYPLTDNMPAGSHSCYSIVMRDPPVSQLTNGTSSVLPVYVRGQCVVSMLTGIMFFVLPNDSILFYFFGGLAFV